MSRASITYGDERFDYDICFLPDRQHKIDIHVHPDASIQVDAPDGEQPDRIHRDVLRRARWVRTQVAQARARREHVLPRSYVSGESHFYLGRRYQLKVTDQNGAGPQVRLLRGRICIESDERSAAAVKKHLYGWYRQRASEVFERRLRTTIERMAWLNDAPPLWLLRMRK
jgi:predicted metal-dependent hydrolase